MKPSSFFLSDQAALLMPLIGQTCTTDSHHTQRSQRSKDLHHMNKKEVA